MKYTFIFIYRQKDKIFTCEEEANSPMEALEIFAQYEDDWGKENEINVIAVLTIKN